MFTLIEFYGSYGLFSYGLLDVDSSLCRGVAACWFNAMSHLYIYIYICLDLMMLNPLLPIAGRAT